MPTGTFTVSFDCPAGSSFNFSWQSGAASLPETEPLPDEMVAAKDDVTDVIDLTDEVVPAVHHGQAHARFEPMDDDKIDDKIRLLAVNCFSSGDPLPQTDAVYSGLSDFPFQDPTTHVDIKKEASALA